MNEVYVRHQTYWALEFRVSSDSDSPYRSVNYQTLELVDQAKTWYDQIQPTLVHSVTGPHVFVIHVPKTETVCDN